MNTAPEYIESADFIAEIIRTRRVKTAKIEVEKGIVSVAVPLELPMERIQALLTTKRRWIKEKLALHSEAMPASVKQYISGEAFPYLGRNYRLKISKGEANKVVLKKGYLQLNIISDRRYVDQEARARRLVRAWYKERAQELIKRKVAVYAEQLGVSPKKVSLKDFKRRWGSCKANGDMEFNWRIVLAPQRMVDYVVAHEVTHLVHHDYSPEFWNALARIFPNYKECREWLKDNEQHLRIGFA